MLLEWSLLLDFAALSVLVMWMGFSHLKQTDTEEGRRNREEGCTPHQWGRVAEGLRCRACGKTPGG